MKLMVFDIGGTDVKYSVVDEQLRMPVSGKFQTPKVRDSEGNPIWEGDELNLAYDAFLDQLKSVYEEYGKETEGIAMSLPGFIDSANGRQCGGGAIPYIIRRDIGKDLSERCGCPVRIANDGKCAAMAEKNSGSLKGCHNASVFIIGTGVGGGLIINDRIINGSHFTAGEYSFFRINLDGDYTDRENSMGYACATTGLLLEYKKKKGLPKEDETDGKLFFEHYLEGEPEAVETLKNFCHRVAVTVQNLTFLMDLEKVAIGGGISKQPALIEGIQKALDEIHENHGVVYDPNMPKATVVPCRYSSEANMIGAYYLFSEELA